MVGAVPEARRVRLAQRNYSTNRRVIAGCFTCNGSDALWTAPNAQGVAAKHHDATGHETWADVILEIRYHR